MRQEFLQMPIKPFTKSHTENNAERCPFSLNLVFPTHTRGEMAPSLSPVLAILSQTRRNQNETLNNSSNLLLA